MIDKGTWYEHSSLKGFLYFLEGPRSFISSTLWAGGIHTTFEWDKPYRPMCVEDRSIQVTDPETIKDLNKRCLESLI